MWYSCRVRVYWFIGYLIGARGRPQPTKVEQGAHHSRGLNRTWSEKTTAGVTDGANRMLYAVIAQEKVCNKIKV